MTTDELVLGIDLGTQGVRILAVDPAGKIAASASVPLPAQPAGLPSGWSEQDPAQWWQAVRTCIAQVCAQLPGSTRIAGISVDSTSGTILPILASGEPLSPAVMYNDQRSEPQSAAVSAAGQELQDRLGYTFASSFALPKILWFQQARPDVFERACRFIHAADFIVGRLTGNYAVTDSSNALKTGYDLVNLTWPEYIEQRLHIPLAKLPAVVGTGTQIGIVSPASAQETGLPVGVPVFAGATDGTTAMIASGASRPGEWNSTLGTTLVLKGISKELVSDPLGRLYFHRHPNGDWMPGGASNTGTEWILKEYPGADLGQLDRLARERIPTGLVRYPLSRPGERFPFNHSGASGFCLGSPCDEVEAYAAGLEGLAMLERLAYAVVASIGLAVTETIYITGGGSSSRIWSEVRASLLSKTMLRPRTTETAMGAAVIAASGCWYASLGEASRGMVAIAERIDPRPEWQPALDEKYHAFLAELKRREYLDEHL